MPLCESPLLSSCLKHYLITMYQHQLAQLLAGFTGLIQKAWLFELVFRSIRIVVEI